MVATRTQSFLDTRVDFADAGDLRRAAPTSAAGGVSMCQMMSKPITLVKQVQRNTRIVLLAT
jgi:hypothetical protein